MKAELLYQQQQESGRLHDELTTLIDIGKALTAHLTMNDVYQVVMQKVSNLLQPQAWSLLVVDEQTRELCFEIVVSPAADSLQGTRLQPGEGIAGWVAENSLPLLVPDVSQDERFAKHVDQRIGFVTHSIVCVPLITSHRTIGVIQLLNGLGRNEFTEQDQRILATIADFTAIAIENARLMEKVSDLTIHDDLTGLFNSRHFQTLCEYELERAIRYDTHLSLVFLDLDHFKLVNDTYGHLTGSRLLKEVALVFQENIRKVDHGARYGGDEFVFLLPSTSKDGAIGMATKLLDKLRQAEFRSDCGELIKVTASLGIATYPTNVSSLRELVQLADESMYRVKRSTRNGVISA